MPPTPPDLGDDGDAGEASQGMKLLTLDYSAERGGAMTDREIKSVWSLGEAYLPHRTPKKKRKADIEHCLKPSQTFSVLCKRNDLTLRATAAILRSGNAELKGAFANAQASYDRRREEVSQQKAAAVGLIQEMSHSTYIAKAEPKQALRTNKQGGGKMGQLLAIIDELSLIQMVEIDALARLRTLLAEHSPTLSGLTIGEVIGILEAYELPNETIHVQAPHGPPLDPLAPGTPTSSPAADGSSLPDETETADKVESERPRKRSRLSVDSRGSIDHGTPPEHLHNAEGAMDVGVEDEGATVRVAEQREGLDGAAEQEGLYGPAEQDAAPIFDAGSPGESAQSAFPDRDAAV